MTHRFISLDSEESRLYFHFTLKTTRNSRRKILLCVHKHNKIRITVRMSDSLPELVPDCRDLQDCGMISIPENGHVTFWNWALHLLLPLMAAFVV